MIRADKDDLHTLSGVIRYLALLWLTKNDANGCYTDRDCDAACMHRLTALQALQEMVNQLPWEKV